MNTLYLDLAQQRNRRVCRMIFNRQTGKKMLIKDKPQKPLLDIFNVKPVFWNNPKKPNFDEII